jgi:hypothetical protein
MVERKYSMNLEPKNANERKRNPTTCPRNLTFHFSPTQPSVWGTLSYILRQKINNVAPSRKLMAVRGYGGRNEDPRRGNPTRKRK